MIGNAGETGFFFENARTYVKDDFSIREKEVSKEVLVVEISMAAQKNVLPRVESSGDFKGLSLGFVLDGRCGFENEVLNFELDTDSTSMMYIHQARGLTRFHTNSFRCICIMIRDEFLDPSIFKQLPLNSEPSLLLRNGRTDPVTRVCLSDLLAGNYHGVLNDIFVQGKVLEILASEFSRILPQQVKTSVPGLLFLTRQDVNSIKKAKDILIRSIDAPPSIPVLSRMVGLNQFKLKKGFRQVFNTTPYAIVREHRMTVARQLLKSSEFNVGEISAMVGIKNPSHFTRVFSRYYGMRPKDVMKTRTYSLPKEFGAG